MRSRLGGTALAVSALLLGTAHAAAPVPTPQTLVATVDPLTQDARQIALTTGLALPLVQSELRLQNAIGQLQEQVATRWPETFGGLWIEPATGLVSIAFTENAVANVATLAASFTAPTLLRPVTVGRSYRDLKAVQERMLADRRAVAAGTRSWPGLTGTRYGLDVDVRENRPVVVTDGHTPATVAALRAAYGDLRVDATGNGSEHACTRSDCKHFVRAGLGTGTTGYPNNCTLGFTVASGQINLETTTAGHCDNGVGYHGGVRHGYDAVVRNYGASDSMTQTTTTDFKAGPWIWVSSGEPARKVTSMQTYAALTVGQWICKSGISTFYSCGSVLSRDYAPAYEFGVADHWNFMLTDMCDTFGDSGAPIFISGQAVGLISGGNDDPCGVGYRGWHSHMHNNANALSVIVVTSDSAPFFSSLSAASAIAATGTITVKFNKPVSCGTVNSTDFTVKVQGQVDYPVTGASCTSDSNQTVTLTVSGPIVSRMSVAVTLLANRIQNPGGQNVAGSTRTTTVP